MKAALDFLRLATWDIAEHTFLLADILSSQPGELEPGKWLQYHGWRRDGFFIGTGEQKQKRHSIVNISGHLADSQFKQLLPINTYYGTRIDLQITIPKPDGVDLNAIYYSLKDKEIKSSCIQSELNDTLYVGARTSDVFTRLYEKPLDKMYLRLEFEFKGKVARAIWRALQNGSSVDQIFQHYLEKSRLPEWVKKHYFEAKDGQTAFAIKKEIEKTDEKILDWLQSIDASVRQALYNENIGENVRMLVMSWANEASNVDTIEELD
jgi:hypothetical protein